LKALGFQSIDIVDIAAIGKGQWLPRLEAADVLYFSGGNRYFLMECLNRSGLAKLLPRLLETRVFVGASGGSMVAGDTLGLKLSHSVFGDDRRRTKDLAGLGYVDFFVVPHLGNPHFPRLVPELVEAAVAGISEKVYALVDNSAVQVVGGRVEVVGNGNWRVYQRSI
jgi:dipeptidase E